MMTIILLIAVLWIVGCAAVVVFMIGATRDRDEDDRL